MSSPQWTRLIRFLAVEDNQIYYGQPLQTGDIGLLYHTSPTSVTAHVLSASPLSPSAKLTTTIRTVRKLLSPLSPSEIRTIRGLGAQFTPVGGVKKQPEVPVLFLKPTGAICGPEDEIVIPRLARGENNDYEVEVCVVMGKKAKDVSVEKALDYVLGYCTSNDVSSRGLCGKGVQWGVGKSFDSWCPLGPVLVSPKALGDVQKLEIRTTVNGQVKQLINTSEMVYSIAELISKMSQGTTLDAGSIILSGTPLPLKRELDKSPFLKHGDEVRVYVEGCGTLINRVVEEGGPLGLAKL